jgi:hypothetical protein
VFAIPLCASAPWPRKSAPLRRPTGHRDRLPPET